MYSFICLAAVSHVVLWNFMELRNKKAREENDDNTPGQVPDEEAQAPVDGDATNDTTDTHPRSKRKKKDGSSSKSIPVCRFCKQVFQNPQALGGHMNCHRGEREKEQIQRAEHLIHKKTHNFAFGFPCEVCASSYRPNYQQGGSSGNHYPGAGGPHVADNAPMMMGNMGTPPRQQQMCQNPNHHHVSTATAEPHRNPSYQGPPQHQAYYQPHNPQHGGSYNYNPGKNDAPRQPLPSPPPQNPAGEPQTSYGVNSGQYQQQGSTSFQDPKPYSQDPTAYSQDPSAYSQNPTSYSRDPKSYSQNPTAYSQNPTAYSQDPKSYSQDPKSYSQDPKPYSQDSYAMPIGGAYPAAVPQHQNHTAGTFNGHHVSPVPGFGASPALDGMAATSHAVRQSTTPPATTPAVSTQFIDQSGNLRAQAPSPSSSGSALYSTGLPPLHPSDFEGIRIHDAHPSAPGPREGPHVFSQQAYRGPCAVHGATNCGPSGEGDAIGRDNHYAGMHVFGNRGADDDLDSTGLMELDHGGGVGSTGRSADTRIHR